MLQSYFRCFNFINYCDLHYIILGTRRIFLLEYEYMCTPNRIYYIIIYSSECNDKLLRSKNDSEQSLAYYKTLIRLNSSKKLYLVLIFVVVISNECTSYLKTINKHPKKNNNFFGGELKHFVIRCAKDILRATEKWVYT